MSDENQTIGNVFAHFIRMHKNLCLFTCVLPSIMSVDIV